MLLRLRPRPRSPLLNHVRFAATNPPSPHAAWYRDTLPAMIPICLLGSAVYLVYIKFLSPAAHLNYPPQGLQLLQLRLNHEKSLDQGHATIAQLEAQIVALQSQAQQQPSKSSKSSWLW
jgi:hypothetical protein